MERLCVLAELSVLSDVSGSEARGLEMLCCVDFLPLMSGWITECLSKSGNALV